MAKLKKLAMLCTALMMTASIAAFAACGDNKKGNSSPDTSVSTPTDNSSEDSSSEDVSSPEDGGNEESTVYYEEIIAGEKGSLAGTAWTDCFGTLTLTLPEAGTYGIFTEESEVMFGAEGATDGYGECNTNYTFEVPEAGNVTLTSYVSPWEDGEVTYTYYVYKMNTLVIEDMEGEATLASNLRAPITFVAPAAGDYVISTNQELNWYNSPEKSDEGVYATSFAITAEEAGAITFYVMLNDFNALDLDFSWNVMTISPVTLTEGETVVDLYANVYRKVTFTATDAGTYTLSAASDLYNIYTGVYGVDEWDSMSWIEGNYEPVFNFAMEAGESKIIHIYYSGYTMEYENGPATIEVPVTISRLQESNPSALVVGANTFTTTEDGVEATFTAEMAGTYSIDDGYFDSMWFADTVDEGWGGDSYREFTLAAGESVTFTIKYAGIITITIEKLPEIISVNVGENIINIPAEPAYLEFVDAVEEATYLISFDGSLVSFVVDQGWIQTEFFSDTELTYSPYYTYIITSKTETAIENFAFTVTYLSGGDVGGEEGGEEEIYDPIVLGENAITVTIENFYCAGTDVTFTAIEAGEYVLKLVDGEEHAEIFVLPNYDFVECPYAFSLDAGEHISFNVCTTAIMTLTEDVIDIIIEKVGGEENNPTEKFIVEGQAYYLRAVDYENSYIQSISDNGKFLVVGASPALTLSFELVEGTTNEYYIKLSNGKYVNSASSGNSLSFGDTAVDAWIIDESAKTVQLKSNLEYYLQYNANAGQERITRYKNTQHAVWFEVATVAAEPVEDKVDITIDKTNDLTIGAGYYLTNANSLTLNGEYTFDWNAFVSNEETDDVNDTVAVDDSFITVLVNDVEITSGTKLTYAEDTVVTIVIKSSDNTQNVYVSFTVTKTPEQVQPDEEWTNNY